MVDQALGNGKNDVKVIAMTKEQVVDMIEKLGTRPGPGDLEQFSPKLAAELQKKEGRTEVLKRIGVTSETPNDYRLVLYIDSAKEVAMSGRYDEKNKTIVADKNLAVVPHHIGDEKWGLGEAMLGDAGKPPLAKHLAIPAGKMSEHSEPGVKASNIELSPADAKKLQGEMKLMVLAGEARTMKLASSDSNASLPGKQGNRNPVLGA
jgi:hypothetical protein